MDIEPRPYAIALWHVVDPREPDEPDEPDEKRVMRWSRRGWHEGQFKLVGQVCTAVISDANLDGLFTDTDAWGIGKTSSDACSYKNSIYRVSKHAWFDSVAYQVTSVDKQAGAMTIRAIDVGVTEAEERAKADPYAKDKKSPRSEKPLAFRHDYKDAMALAKKENKRVVTDFVTTWCGPCRVMDQLVYTAKLVVDNSKDLIFISSTVTTIMN